MTEVGPAMGTINGLHLPFTRQFPVDFWVREFGSGSVPGVATKLICCQDIGPPGEENLVCHTKICASPFLPPHRPSHPLVDCCFVSGDGSALGNIISVGTESVRVRVEMRIAV